MNWRRPDLDVRFPVWLAVRPARQDVGEFRADILGQIGFLYWPLGQHAHDAGGNQLPEEMCVLDLARLVKNCPLAFDEQTAQRGVRDNDLEFRNQQVK